MARTNTTLVQALLGVNYDSSNSPDLQQFVDAATLFVDRVATCATTKDMTLSTAELEMIERWWSAHLYTKLDPVYQSKSTLSASGSFVRAPKIPEPYKDGAISLDPSGCVAALSENKRARMLWLGKPPSEQVDYVDRD